jgi:ribosomal protein L37AE/L43A
MGRDHKAEYGSQPTWDLQRDKQDEVARGTYETAEDCPQCGDGDVHVVGHKLFRCFTCGNTFGTQE